MHICVFVYKCFIDSCNFVLMKAYAKLRLRLQNLDLLPTNDTVTLMR